MKLSTKIIVVTLLAIVPVTVGIVYASFTLTQDVIIKKVTEAQEKTAVETIDKIDRTLNEYYKNIQLIGEMLFVQELLLHGGGEHQHTENEHREFTKLLNLTGPWKELFVINNEDLVETSTEALESNIPMPQTELLREVVTEARSGQVAYSDAVDNDGVTTMLFAAPIRDNSEPGRPLLGVVVGSVAMPTIIEILDELETAAALYNENGNVIGMAKNKSSNIVFDSTQTLEGHEIEQADHNTKRINDTLYTLVRQPGHTNYRGSDWTLVLASPEQVITGEANQSALKIAAMFALAMIVVLALLVALLERLVIRPARQLTYTVQEITKGDLSKRATVGSKDEIGQLGTAFNHMTARLETSHKELDTKVQERTNELEEKVDELERLNQAMVGRELRMVELKKEVEKLRRDTDEHSESAEEEQKD